MPRFSKYCVWFFTEEDKDRVSILLLLIYKIPRNDLQQ
jgi:hypothetical protein